MSGVVHVGQPFSFPAGPGVRLVPEVQQADVAEGLGAEPAHLDVVLEDGERLGQLVRDGLEELPLVVVARPPGEAAADVQPLPLHVEEHVLRQHPLGRGRVVGTAGGVDVVVAAEPPGVGRGDPPLQLDGDLVRPGGRDLFLPHHQPVLGAAAVHHRELARRQEDRVPVGPVDLLLEEQVRGEPLRLRREDVAGGVGEREPADGRLAVDVGHLELDRDAGLDVEEDRDLGLEPEFLGPLADVEPDGGFPLAGLGAVHECDGVLGLQPAQLAGQRRGGDHLDLEEPVLDLRVVLRVPGLLVGPGVPGAGLRAGDLERLLDRALVHHLDQDGDEPGLLQDRLGRPPGHLHPALGVDGDDEQHPGVEEFLDRPGVLGVGGRLQVPGGGLRERGAEERERLHQPLGVGGEWLALDGDDRRRVGGERRGHEQKGGEREASHGGALGVRRSVVQRPPAGRHDFPTGPL
jgi:hypothetical protein